MKICITKNISAFFSQGYIFQIELVNAVSIL